MATAVSIPKWILKGMILTTPNLSSVSGLVRMTARPVAMASHLASDATRRDQAQTASSRARLRRGSQPPPCQVGVNEANVHERSSFQMSQLGLSATDGSDQSISRRRTLLGSHDDLAHVAFSGSPSHQSPTAAVVSCAVSDAWCSTRRGVRLRSVLFKCKKVNAALQST